MLHVIDKHGRSLFASRVRDLYQNRAKDSGIHRTLHNDINPTNVMLDDQGHPVIIDFDPCAQIGQDMDCRKGGTFGWVREPEPRTCTVESDQYALSLITQYLDGKVDNAGFPIPSDFSQN
ncbi:hypothetical protein F5887DRAFT_957577 [Amanita rubescens]|nr:hypothetical protein F5887DRAFT_957577 [Amanita rubescens]